VNSQGLGKQIQREIKAHPVKAGVLGLGLLVALWFWAPLVIGWLPGSEKAGTKAPALSATPSAATATPSETATASKPNWNPNWTEMVAWVRSDELMHPAAPLEKGRDPFRIAAPAPSAVSVQPAPPPKINPENLGLQLSGTLIGLRESVANINGKTFVLPHAATGRGVPVAIKQQEQEHQFILRSIGPEQVQMEFQGQPFQLKVREFKPQDKPIQLDERSTIEFHSASGVR
jgi:hypothetical protein